MAGGSGTRFWPLSRRKHPKQLLGLFGRDTLLEQTVNRIRSAIPPDRIYVFTSQLVQREVRRRLPEVPSSQIVAEPAARNTAPTIGLAAHEILRRDPQGLLVVLPSDHLINKPAEFRRALAAACTTASPEGRSVILGLKPTRPETGYGYLRLGRRSGRCEGQEIYRVEKFVEKPSLDLARRYMASGRYLWNAGMFIWRASTLLANLELFQPRMAGILARIAAAGGVKAGKTLRRLYPRVEKISIDYALMEKISNVDAIAADLGWSDIGSWAVVYDLNRKDRDGNVKPKTGVCLHSRKNMIISPQKAVVAVGVENLVIVETADALLVCHRDHAQDVGKAVQELERRGAKELL